MAPNNVQQSVSVYNCFGQVIYSVTLCPQSCCVRLSVGQCVWADISGISFKQRDWNLDDLRVYLPPTDFCVWSLNALMWITPSPWYCLVFTTFSQTILLFLLMCILLSFLLFFLLGFFFAIKLVLTEPDKWHGVWVGWAWDTYVVVLFWYYLRSPHFSWAQASVSLLLLCDMIQRLYLFLSSLWYSQRQRQSCSPDRWLCREAQHCQKRIAVCCHHTDVI